MECWALILGTVLGVAVMVVVMMMVPSWVAPWWGRLLLLVLLLMLWRLLWRWRWRFIVSGVAAVVGTASAAAVSVVVVAAAVAIASEAEEELFQSCFCSAVAIETSHTLLLCLKQMVDRFLFNFHTFLKKTGQTPASFLFLFGLFKQTIQCPSSIRRKDLNPQPFKHESSFTTFRPGLLPFFI